MQHLNTIRLKQLGYLIALLVVLSVSLRAETLQAIVQLSPSNEIPPIQNLDATGIMLVTIEITRNSAGAITAAKMSFSGSVAFAGSVTVQGLHIHEGDSRTNGGVRFDSGLSSSNNIIFSGGSGVIVREVATVNMDVLPRLLANPAGFYVNLHTSANPSGAIRAQLTRFTEPLSSTVAMSSNNEVPPIAGLNAIGSATITVNPTRNASGVITAASVNFSVGYDFPAGIIVRGLHIHEGAAGVNGPIRLDTGLSPTNTINATTGRGVYSHTVLLTDAAPLGALGRMLNNPSDFYVNLHTSVNPGGAIRGQLGGTFRPSPVIAQASAYTLTTAATGATVNLLAVNIDAASEPLLNGVPVPFTVNPNTGQIAVQLPAEARANPGVLALQIRAGNGLISPPVFVVVAANEGTAAAVTDAAGYGTTVAPESIAAAFGTALATQNATTGAILPNALDGTSVYLNGRPSPLFFVSMGQANFQVPENTVNGPATVIIRNRDGGVARAIVNIAGTGAGLFTRLANGKGAPAAVASNDNGQTYTIVLSNADGTPVEIEAGNIAVLFATGLRFRSSSEVRASAAGIDLTPSFAGAQGTLIGLDQINLTISNDLRGKGETDLVFTVDGKATNAVRIKIR